MAEITDLQAIENSLKEMLKAQAPHLQIRTDSPTNFEAAGTKPAMQGKQKVNGFYFASVMPKPKDVRFYFFPIYTHPDAFSDISDEFRKCLKGKSCFHIKKMSPGLKDEIEAAIQKGVELYQKDDLI
ncbi:MAG: hypothetical protein KDC24_02645 [Saprospiraceae bacterium]|nr:hypothetical protein [Saprospiraceae bacterium]